VKLSLRKAGTAARGEKGGKPETNDSFVSGFLKLTGVIADEEEKRKCELNRRRFSPLTA
jgi:hypothetical protein